MNRRTFLGLAVAVGLLGLAGLTLGGALAPAGVDPGQEGEAVAPAPSAPRRPNVVVVVWDTTRADRLSLYGHHRPTTPLLESWAAEARVYEQARSPGIWTLPAHASLFTGLPPATHGAEERWMWLDDRHETLAELLGAAGYRTFAFAANTLLSRDTNLVQGFDVVLNTFHGKVKELARQATRRKILPKDRSNELAPLWTPPEHGATNAEWARAAYKDAAPLVVEGLFKWLDEAPGADRPFFAFLNLMEAHTPRIPSLAARRKLMDEELFRLSLETDAAHINLHFYNFGKRDYSEAELEAIRAVYDASLIDLDQATQALIAGLSERGLLEDTAVVLTSDHGENLGDHHLFNHRFALYDSLARVPLVVRYPRAFTPGREARPVSTQDLFATLLELAGVAPPDQAGQRSFPLPRRDEDPRAAPGVVTSLALPLEREIETVRQVHPEVQLEPWLRSGESWVRGPHKLLRFSDGRRERYDLGADPAERHNRFGEDPSLEAELEAELDRWLQGQRKYDPEARGPRDNPKNVRAGQEDLRRQLEALGYVQEE